ncbi:MAG: alpha/beta hydrolase-fold protein [Verrucomicrobiales bacterium]|nr:alpha/beta hydrolase-fold protein [Verrucomicrobiales bacterium]
MKWTVWILVGLLMSDVVDVHANPDAGFPKSPEVHADGRVTFRIPARSAEKVVVWSGVFGRDGLALVKGERGVWEGTSEVLAAGIYDYTFDVDGTTTLDPHNREVKAWRRMASQFLVPGSPAKVWEVQDVGHGEVHLLRYASEVLGGAQREMRVYTPPGYAESGEKVYPVLYLLHGSGDDPSAWTLVGRGDVIADNLIAGGKAAPMVIVMPHGHAEMAEDDLANERNGGKWYSKNNTAFYADFFSEVVPRVEKRYRVRKDKSGRAVAGLSMGGGQALEIGLNHGGEFGAIGAFSSATPAGDEDAAVKVAKLGEGGVPELVWIGIGKGDFLFERNEFFHGWLGEKGVAHEYVVTEGGHEWGVWRDYLEVLLPKLFR